MFTSFNLWLKAFVNHRLTRITLACRDKSILTQPGENPSIEERLAVMFGIEVGHCRITMVRSMGGKAREKHKIVIWNYVEE